MSHVQTLYKFEQNRTICCLVIDDLAHFCRPIYVGHHLLEGSQGCGLVYQIWGGHRTISGTHQVCFKISDILLCSETQRRKGEWC